MYLKQVNDIRTLNMSVISPTEQGKGDLILLMAYSNYLEAINNEHCSTKYNAAVS